MFLLLVSIFAQGFFRNSSKPCERYVGTTAVLCQITPGVGIFAPYPLGTTCKRTGNICIASSKRLDLEELHEQFVGDCRIGLYGGKYTCAIQETTLVGSEKKNENIACLNLGQCDFFYTGIKVLKKLESPEIQRNHVSCATISSSKAYVLCQTNNKPYIFPNNTRCVESGKDCVPFKNEYETPVPVLLDNDVLQQEFLLSCSIENEKCKKGENDLSENNLYYHVVCLEVNKECSFYTNSVPLIAIHGSDLFTSCLDSTSDEAKLVLCKAPYNVNSFVAYDFDTKCYMESGTCVGRNKSGHVLKPRALADIERLQYHFKQNCVVSNVKQIECKSVSTSKNNYGELYRYGYGSTIVGCLFLKNTCSISYIKNNRLHLLKSGSKIENKCEAGFENNDHHLCEISTSGMIILPKDKSCPYSGLHCSEFKALYTLTADMFLPFRSNLLLYTYSKNCVLKSDINTLCAYLHFDLTTHFPTNGEMEKLCLCVQKVGRCKLYDISYPSNFIKRREDKFEMCGFVDQRI